MTTKTYGDLDLKAIRIAANIDFAHFTFQKKMCSCCNSPVEFPTRYWRDEETKQKALNGGDYTYFLFKNAENGSGTVKKSDSVKKRNFIIWSMSMEQLDIVVRLLSEQLGEGYQVLKPENDKRCIEIVQKETAHK